jgi:large subunit ribosomal protein L18e
MRKTETTNPELIKLIRHLKKQSKENKAKIWQDMAEDLSRSRRRRISVNLSHLNRHTEKNETVAVPGKVLGTGTIDHAVTVTAFAFSSSAKAKIEAANGKCLSFANLIKKNPKGSNVQILG